MKFTLFILLVLASSCGKFRIFKKSSQEKQDISKIYANGNLTVSVFYEDGAEPFADSVSPVPGVTGLKVWNVLEANLKAMFPGKVIVVPKDLAQMSKINSQTQLKWTYNEMVDLGNSSGMASTTDTTVFNIYFVKGKYETNDNVIGVHLSNTKTLVLFKEVITGSSETPTTQRYIEQSTLVHEMGHAVGLVNNGIPMTSVHEDTTKRAHCNNPDCVMYWRIDGTSSMASYIQNHLLKLDPVMLDQNCLKDVTSYK